MDIHTNNTHTLLEQFRYQPKTLVNNQKKRKYDELKTDSKKCFKNTPKNGPKKDSMSKAMDDWKAYVLQYNSL